MYLYGSLVWGDFDLEISDIDLLAITASELNEKEFSLLNQMHVKIWDENRKWRDRIEIAYVPLPAIKTFRTQKSNIAVISPGEPFHFKEAGKDWLINWYMVQEKGKTIYGPDPKSIIPHISKDEFIQGVREQAVEWKSYIKKTRDSRPYQGYAILTLCRALYAVKNGEQVSKKQAAKWVKSKFPEWAGLIDSAFLWREDLKNKKITPEDTFAETTKFASQAIDRILAG